MTDSDGAQPTRGSLSWLRNIFRPQRPVRPPIVRQDRDVARDTLRMQIDVVRRAFDGQLAVASASEDDADAEFLYRPGHVLVRRDDREKVERFFGARQEEYRGVGEVVDDRSKGSMSTSSRHAAPTRQWRFSCYSTNSTESSANKASCQKAATGWPRPTMSST